MEGSIRIAEISYIELFKNYKHIYAASGTVPLPTDPFVYKFERIYPLITTMPSTFVKSRLVIQKESIVDNETSYSKKINKNVQTRNKKR